MFFAVELLVVTLNFRLPATVADTFNYDYFCLLIKKRQDHGRQLSGK